REEHLAVEGGDRVREARGIPDHQALAVAPVGRRLHAHPHRVPLRWDRRARREVVQGVRAGGVVVVGAGADPRPRRRVVLSPVAPGDEGEYEEGAASYERAGHQNSVGWRRRSRSASMMRRLARGNANSSNSSTGIQRTGCPAWCAGSATTGAAVASRQRKAWRVTVKCEYAWSTRATSSNTSTSRPSSSFTSRRHVSARGSSPSRLPPGNSHSPPSIASSGRFWTSTRPASASTIPTETVTWGTGFFFETTG